MSHDVSLGCSHPSEGKTEAGEAASKMAHWQVGPGSWQNASCPCYVDLLKGPQDIVSGFPQSEHSKRKLGGSRHVFCDCPSLRSHTPLLLVYSVRSKPLSLAHIQRKGNQPPPFEGTRVKEFVDIF